MNDTGTVRLAGVADVPPGAMLTVTVDGRSLVLCNVDGRIFAIDATCPHRGGPLVEGDLDGSVVTCPWHGWRWDVTTGASLTAPALRVGCVPVGVEGGAIVVRGDDLARSRPDVGV
jgi:nitrite reductase/ring-hydroxylating ferredoxin subunit